MRIPMLAALCAALLATAARPASTTDPAAQLRDRALKESNAYALVESLTRDVGARPAGSPGDAKAVAWALRAMKAAGLANVHAEPVTVPHWERGTIAVDIVGDQPQSLVAVALGGSVATTGMTAPVLEVESLDQLRATPPESVRGRIVFFNRRMERHADGSGYGIAVAARTRGPAEAARRGAVGVVIRSAGTSRERVAHTGATRYDDTVRRIPAAALSNIDADLLEQRLRDGPVRLALRIGSRELGAARSANVVGEVPGRSREVVLLGAHLDSWDTAPSANDDGAGVAIAIEAARLVAATGTPPARTLRVVLFANEEFGLDGAKAYAKAHAAELAQHAVAMEADFGSAPVKWLHSQVGAEGLPAVRRITDLVSALGVLAGTNDQDGGADLIPLRERGVPVLDPLQDGTHYFDIHHTPLDTLERIDRAGLAQNVAVYAVAAWVAAEHGPGFGRLAETWAE